MLVLTIKPDEALHIGDDVSIKIVCKRGRQFRVGVEAPKDVKVIKASSLKNGDGPGYDDRHEPKSSDPVGDDI